MFLAIFHPLKKNFYQKGKFLKGIVSQDGFFRTKKVNLFFVCVVMVSKFG
jgi:hypothetical protein